MTGTIKSRLEKLEQEERFRDWLESMRLLENFSDEQLEEFCQKGYLSGPYPDPPAPGQCTLDQLDRKTLIRMWQEQQQALVGRSTEEMDFYARHGHWPEPAGPLDRSPVCLAFWHRRCS